MSQPEGRRRSLRIIESRRKILRDAIRDIVEDYKRAQRRQRLRAMPFGTLSNRSGPSKIGSSAWYARWRSNDVPIKPLNSVPGSENAKKNGGVWCVYVITVRVKCTSNDYFIFVASLRHSSSPGKCSIPQSVSGAVGLAFIWPVNCKACTRCMAAPTNIFGGAFIVDAISWTVKTRMSSISASMK